VEVPPVALEGSKVEERRGKPVSLVKVIWDRRTGDSTWELEEDMRKLHPHLFCLVSLYFRGRKFCCSGEYKTHFSPPLLFKGCPNPLGLRVGPKEKS